MFPVIRSSARRGSCDAAGQGVGGGNFGRLYMGSRKKKRPFYGHADRKGLPPRPPLRSGCCDFFKISCHILTYFTIL